MPSPSEIKSKKSLDNVVTAIQSASLVISDALRVLGAEPLAIVKSISSSSSFSKSNPAPDQQPLDVFADQALASRLSSCSEVRGFASEERPSIVSTGRDGYFVSYDPLDGSQNIPVNINTGLIFAIFKWDQRGVIPKSGRDIVASGYALFGPATKFIWAQPGSVNEFLYHPSKKTWVKINTSSVSVPNKGKVYAANEGIAPSWINTRPKKFATIMRGRSVRWMACMASDAHRILFQGGAFLLPKAAGAREGKLRLVYEAYPLAFLFECAGGVGLTEDLVPILDLPFPGKSNNLHQKVSVFLAGKQEGALFAKL